jgi:uncharacterized FlaG/YvyC family protein
VVAATIAIPIQTASAQSTNTISACQQSNTTYCRNQGNQQNQQGDNTQGNSIANQVTSINPHTNAINNVQYSITKSSGITIEKNDTANLTN